MIDTEMLREAIKPGTSESLIYWILFTNHHHNSHRTPEETVAKFQGTELGKSIDFKILEKLMHRNKFIHCAIYFKDGSKRFIEIDQTGLSSDDIHRKAMDYVKQENISESSVVEVRWPVRPDDAKQSLPNDEDVRHCGIFLKDGTKKYIQIDCTGLSEDEIHKKSVAEYVKQENISEDCIVETNYPLRDHDQPANPPVRSCIERESKVTVTFSHAQAAELFNLLEANKDQHPDLHELVYQAMTQELFSRINTGGLQ